MVDGGALGVPALAGLIGSAPGWLPWVGAAGAAASGGAAVASLMSKPPATPQVNVPAPPGVAPAQTPAPKPAKKSQYQSFLSGAASTQTAGGAGAATGKSLLGA